MSKRRYTRIKEYESVNVAMREAGKTSFCGIFCNSQKGCEA